MIAMKKALNCLVGYSDHTLGLMVPIMAATLGAVVIEKHFTLNKKLHGPDHKASLEPEELIAMITAIRDVKKILGSYEKRPTKSEKTIMKLVRKSIIANQDIKKDSILNKNMFIIKRPGTGMPPEKLESIIGKKAIREIKKDEIIKQTMVE